MSLISFGEAKHHVYQDKNQDDFICIRFMCHLNHEQNNHYAKNQKFSNGVLFHINLPLEFRFVWLFIFLNYIIASFCSNRKAKLKSDFSYKWLYFYCISSTCCASWDFYHSGVFQQIFQAWHGLVDIITGIENYACDITFLAKISQLFMRSADKLRVHIVP